MESPIKRKKESGKGHFNLESNNEEYLNTQLKKKLKVYTTEMKDAIEKMNSMTLEMNRIGNENLLYKDRVVQLEQENALLISQIEEMVNERAERDAILDEFGAAVDARIVEWKAILDEKDTTITKLKANLQNASTERITNNSPDEKNHTEIQQLIKDIDCRDKIIAELQSKLSEAVVEINESSLLIEKFKSDLKPKDITKQNSTNNLEINKKIQYESKRINTLENLLERAERDAKLKSEQLCDALTILNKYEDENASLTEALEEIKELKVQLKKKSQHIEDLVDITNKLELENSRFEEAIIILRDKLEISEVEEASIEDLILQRQQEQETKIKEMQRDHDQLYSENIDLKFQIRKLKRRLKASIKNKLNQTIDISSEDGNDEELTNGPDSKKEFVELYRIKKNFKGIIEENEALRQGMHEILDCIHKQDAKSIVTIQSQTLENLLEALDARHLAGWYHPAMRLLGRVNYLQGSNAELRSQLQQIRKNQMLFRAETDINVGSMEEGECSQQKNSPTNATLDDKENPQIIPMCSRNLTPKSTSSLLSQNADSGRASGKAVEIDEIQQIEVFKNAQPSESGGDIVMDDEKFLKKSEEIYAMSKGIIAQESDFKKMLNNSTKYQKILENQIITLRKNLANFISPEIYNELREKYLETNMRFRAAFEDKLLENYMKGEIRDIDFAKNKTVQELRNELISVHKLLSDLTVNNFSSKGSVDAKIIEKLENHIVELKAENEMLKKSAEIANEEALVHRAIDSTILHELNEVRQRILKFEINEDQEIKKNGRISLEIANYKVIETELREQKKLLENEILRMREELVELRKQQRNDEELSEQNKSKNNFKDFIEIIDFLQQQYAGSTSLSALERYETNKNKLENDQNEVKQLISKMNDQNESLNIQHDTLKNRLHIVEQLKDMLEQQIGSNDVQDIMHKFTNETRQILSESTYKEKVNHLEKGLTIANSNIFNYEAKIASLEQELIKTQKTWKVYKVSNIKKCIGVDKMIETDKKIILNASPKERETKSSQTEVKMHSVEVQCTLCCKPVTNAVVRNINNNRDETEKDMDDSEIDNITRESENETLINVSKIALLQEQLGQALSLASERSIALSKCESQLAEYSSKNEALTKLLDEKTSALVADHAGILAELSKAEEAYKNGATSHEALQSTINSFQKIIQQKEETITRYQSLLKEDRDKHSEAASRLHEEIKSLRRQITVSRSGARPDDNSLVANTKCPERDVSIGEIAKSDGRPEEASTLREKISRLETELAVSAELAERWHRLAEDRLRHMDSTRERLENQHKEEIESYRMELNKRHNEVDGLRRQLSESRRSLTTKTEVLSFMKTLQIKDNRLADEIENELEEHVAVTSQQLSGMRNVGDSQLFEFEKPQTQLDNLRRQVQMLMEREKSYKSNIAELQQRLSRKYMSVKAQEKKASRREIQLERKVKELEKELNDSKEVLEHHFMVQQAKRIKTAEDLGLWEKLKKWQQTAEKLKEKLKEKTEECQRLQNNYEKLRNLISCIEREKWYLREKYRNESISMNNWMPPPTPSVLPNRDVLVEDLQKECQELRERVKELVDRLNHEDNEKNDEHKDTRSIFPLFEIDEYGHNEAKGIRDITTDILEKENLRLEAENFELRLELERANVNLPRYQEKIQHLEKYVELLKSEKSAEASLSAMVPRRECGQRTKIELERTVIALKKLVEKLQFENKKLRDATLQEALDSPCECHYLREERERARQRIAELEVELELLRKRLRFMEEATLGKSDEDSVDEACILREQLNRKSELLLKVKDLLTKAALNEKALRQRIQQLEFKQTLSIIPECGSSFTMT